jgi:hypothetical protein
MTAAIDLDVLLKNYLAFVDQGGKDLLTNPFYSLFSDFSYYRLRENNLLVEKLCHKQFKSHAT